MMAQTSPSYWLEFGFCEGPRHATYLHRALRAKGFTPAATIEAADIVLAHSGGCFLLPDYAHKIVFFCQPACAYQRPVWRIFMHKIRLDIAAHRRRHQVGRWLWKSGWNLVYSVSRLARNRDIARHARRYRSVLPIIHSNHHIVYINKYDPFSREISMAATQRKQSGVYIGLAAAHDDMWTDPEPFVASVQSLYARLLAETSS